MEPCPQLTDLNEPGADLDTLAAHAKSCDTCRALALLAAGHGTDVELSADCEQLEPLIAAAADGPLRAEDRQSLDNHLDGCGRCSAVAATLYLEDAMPMTIEPAADAPSIGETRAVSPMRKETADPTRRAPFWAATVAIAAAAVLLVLWKGFDNSGGSSAPVVVTDNPQQDVGAGRRVRRPRAPGMERPTSCASNR
jgi:anti-sigma factor RsiW